MSTTCAYPRLARTPKSTKVLKATSQLVPEAKVKEMLRDIAFVLHCTRRVSQEIRQARP